MRTMALSEPKEYANERNKHFAVLEERVKATYENTRKELEKSGLPISKILELASNAAAATYSIEDAILETRFPSGSNEAAMQSFGKSSFPGMTAPVKPRATAKPRAAAKPRKSRAKAKA